MLKFSKKKKKKKSPPSVVLELINGDKGGTCELSGQVAEENVKD